MKTWKLNIKQEDITSRLMVEKKWTIIVLTRHKIVTGLKRKLIMIM